jgi:long-chain acyl-CoA synthetase
MYKQLKEVWRELTAADEMFAITEVDVGGVPVKAFAAAPPSLRDVWLASGAFADRDYLIYQDERWTYAQAHKDVASIANWLRAEGVGPGDRVAIAMRNYPEWMLAYWAIISAGAAVVGMNAWWVTDEMLYGVNDATPKVIIADQDRLARIIGHVDKLGGAKLVGVRLSEPMAGDITPWSELTAQGGGLPEIAIDPDDDACIFYTSGTTGRPKGAQLTHRGCVNNIMNLAFAAAVQGRAIARAEGTEAELLAQEPTVPASLLTTPLFHVTANNCVAHGTTLAGGKLIHMFRWDAGEALRLIEEEKITGVTGVPVMAREIINHPDFPNRDTSSLVTLGGGGAQLPPDLVGKIDEAVATAKPNTGYGMTEVCGIITAIAAEFFVDKPDSAGPAMPVYDTKCVDEDGNEVALGETGELWVKGAPVIKGYLNRPDATAESITDGWLHTGDIARLDEDGFIYIVDRAKDMVLRGGENIYCAEVENTIFKHDAVAEVSVFGLPDDRLGEEVGAAIVLREDMRLSAEALRDHCATLMAKQKVPRYIWFMDEALPRNASGKFLRRELKERLDVAEAV